MNLTIVSFALLTGLVTGGVFAFLEVPIPAPPNLAGVMGIVGIYLGYIGIETIGTSFDLMAALGLG
ncbi:MAG: XapX domain-containing protein [Halodesulfurarchaeum sp.]